MTTPNPTSHRHLSPGTILADSFEIVEFLGAGCFGEVYRAKQLIFGRAFREVALKLFAEGIVTSENAYETLNDALVVFGLLDENPNLDVAAHLVQVYNMGIVSAPSPRAFMSMRLIQGGKTLKSEVYRFRHGSGMPVSLSLRYMRELLLPLAWMHSLETPALHGDLKPDNVMLTEDSRLVLVDFGLAARMPLGVRGGAIDYEAPEKLEGLIGEEQADVYSVGIIWYELLTGCHPFKDVGIEARAQGDSEAFTRAHIAARKWPICAKDKLPVAQQQNRIVPASEINEDLAQQHPQIELLLNKCLADDISERFSNARVLLDHINDYIEQGTFASSDLEVMGVLPEKLAKVPVAKPREKTLEGKLADAEALLTQAKPEQALAIVDGILRVEPECIPALLKKAKILASMPNRLNDADDVCRRAMAIAPEDPAVYRTLADICEAKGKCRQAEGFRKYANELERSKRIARRSY